MRTFETRTTKLSRNTLFAVTLVLAACNSGTPSPANEPPQASPASELPPGHPPIGTSPTPGHAPASTDLAQPASAGGLRWTHAEPLVRRTPKSSMRAAEYGLASDAQAELAVFYFGPDQGGSVDANVTRWLGQITQADGSDTASKAQRTTRDVNGVAVTRIEASGRYGGGMAMPGAPQAASIDDAMLLGAIASGPQGPVFFKLVGPRASVEQARGAFDAMIASLSPTEPR